MAPGSPHGARFPRHVVRLRLKDIDLALWTEPGLFSYRVVDTGTTVLLEQAPFPPCLGNVLDLGCGYGPIALTLGIRAPAARVWAVDTDERALDLTEENVQRARLSNVIVRTPRTVPADLVFDAIYSNPPMRIGKQALRALLAHWLDRLDRTGNAYVVIKQDAGADAVARWLAEEAYPIRRIASKRGYRVLRVQPRARKAAWSWEE